MTGRVRWNDTSPYTKAGAYGPFSFTILRMGTEPGWMLTAELPGLGRKNARSDDLEELKAQAECWLEEFVCSLGASFPDGPAEEHKLPLVGHDLVLVKKLAGQVNREGLNGHSATRPSMTADGRGFRFEVLIHVDRKPTGHVAKVTVVLDRVEDQP